MSDAVLVALISAGVSLIGIFVSQSNIFHKLDTNQQVMETKMSDMNRRIDEHNHYAKLFNENVPVIKEQIKNTNLRIDTLYKEVDRKEDRKV